MAPVFHAVGWVLAIALVSSVGGILTSKLKDLLGEIGGTMEHEAKCSAFLMHTLSAIPSVFGRLAYLASLWDPNTARYHHRIMSVAFGDEEANRTLRKCHEKIFRKWLFFTLEQQKADLIRYLSAGETGEEDLLEMWSGLKLYQHLLPPEQMDAERQLFVRDLEVILSIMCQEK